MSFLLVLFIIAALLQLTVGIYSLVMTRNLMRILISIEICTKAVTLAMIAAGYYADKMAAAQAYVITIIIIELAIPAETADSPNIKAPIIDMALP